MTSAALDGCSSCPSPGDHASFVATAEAAPAELSTIANVMRAGGAVTELATGSGHGRDAYLLTAAGLARCPDPTGPPHPTTAPEEQP